MTKYNLEDAAHELDHTNGNMNLNKILISDITNEMAQFSEYSNEAHPELAQLYMVEARSKLRLLTTLLLSVEKDMARDSEQLAALSESIFTHVVRNGKMDAKKAQELGTLMPDNHIGN